MKEQDIQKQIIDYLEFSNFYVVKIISCNKRGVPDILACSPRGEFVGIEVKTGDNKLSKLQDINLKQITSRRGVTFVTNNLKNFKQQFEFVFPFYVKVNNLPKVYPIN